MTKRQHQLQGGSPDERFARAAQAFNSGNVAEARRICQDLTKKPPGHANAFNLLGAIYRSTGANDRAVESIERAIALDPSNASFHYNMGIAVDAAGDRARALSHFKRVHKLDPKLIKADPLIGWYMQLGVAKVAAGDVPAAAQAFLEALTMDPNAADIGLMSDIEPSQSIPLYEEMLRLDPANAAVLEKLAFAHLLAGHDSICREQLAAVDAAYGAGSPEATHIQNIYSAGLLATRTPPSYRRRRRFANLVKVFDSVRHLDGAIAECGCLKGLSAHVLASRVRDNHAGYTGNDFHIFDSFAGLSEPLAVDVKGADDRVAPNLKKGAFAASRDIVRSNLAAFPDIKLYEGWIPDRFGEVADLSFRFLNLDVDLYEPTKASIAFFYPRLVPGGVISSDDYNWPGCRAAIEECRAEFGYEVVFTETDQAVIRKP